MEDEEEGVMSLLRWGVRGKFVINMVGDRREHGLRIIK